VQQCTFTSSALPRCFGAGATGLYPGPGAEVRTLPIERWALSAFGTHGHWNQITMQLPMRTKDGNEGWGWCEDYQHAHLTLKTLRIWTPTGIAGGTSAATNQPTAAMERK